ncbi:MAG: gamma-glutamyltransferase [Methylobacteriaceae bacterium]|nr:gamma-glutamyltransferase [Methylobacteriaceae bacterium]
MVATSHPRATLAGLDALRKGGNAIDAAVCAAAVQAVVEPTQTGIGGDCFALFMRERDTAPSALNGSGWSPKAANLDWYRDRAITEIEVETPHAVTVPGAVAAWEKLIIDHGRLPWDRVLAPAIEAAENGSCIPERLARDWGKQLEKLKRNRAAARLFLFDGQAPMPGQVHRQPALAKTLREIAHSGARAFYEGRIADSMIKTLQVEGGLHVAEDFAAFAPEYVEPISVAYRGYDLWECPPNGQGLVPMLIVKALEGFDLSAWTSVSVERFHVMAELARQAYAERDLFIADPRSGENPVNWLLSDGHIRHLRSNVALDRRIANVDTVLQRPHRDTVFIAAIDRDRMAVSLINSVFEDFGAGLVCEDTGVLFHNRASSFVLDDGHPNCIAGRKRPMHTIIPAMLTKQGRAIMSFGVTGAHFQPFGQVQILTNIVDYGLPIQAAIDHPRIFARGDTFEVERAVPEAVVTGLRKLGHHVTRPVNPLGTAQAIWIDRDLGVLRGGADGRRDGIALGY